MKVDMGQKNIYFISDLHLGAHYLDKRESERRVTEFLLSIKDDAEELFLLGDILDYWFEYRNVVPQGHVRFLGTLATLADAGVKITWLTGNHDVWLRQYLAREIGLRVIHRNEIITLRGKKFFISHGDDVGRRPFSYRFMRFCFYNPVCQWLYAAVHPRWTTAIANGWSTHNRVSRSQKSENEEAKRGLEDLSAWVVEHSKVHPEVDFYVMGHLHIPHYRTLDNGAVFALLGNWINMSTYAVFDGERLVLRSATDDKEITINE